MSLSDEYDKLANRLIKEYFSLDEVRKLVNNDLVAKIAQEEPDREHPNCRKFALKLTNDDLYYIYVKDKK